MIEIRNLKKSFGSQVVLNGISLSFERNQTTAILGPSGTGKSVLLKILTGLLPADSGEVLIDGASMTEASPEEQRALCARMGVLFQGAALFDSLTLIENIAFPLFYRTNLSRREIFTRSYQRLAEVGLDGSGMRLPGEVSIGMRKRVGIARALVTEPDVLLFDEPNTGLDPEMGQEIYDLINETKQIGAFTGIVVSHEIPEVFQVCDRVVMLYDGMVQHDGTIEDFLASPNPVVKQFVAGSVDGPIEF